MMTIQIKRKFRMSGYLMSNKSAKSPIPTRSETTMPEKDERRRLREALTGIHHCRSVLNQTATSPEATRDLPEQKEVRAKLRGYLQQFYRAYFKLMPLHGLSIDDTEA